MVQVDQGRDRHQGRAPVHADQHRRAAAGVPAAGRPHRHLAEDRRPSCASNWRRMHALLARPTAAPPAASSCAPTPRRRDAELATTSPTCARPGPPSARAAWPAAGHAAAPGPEPGQRVLRDLSARRHRQRSASTRRCSSTPAGLRREYMPGSEPSWSTTRRAADLRPYGIEGTRSGAGAARRPEESGGYPIIDQTEALTTIDVNTGGFVGARNFDDTIFKTNLEAALAIARQLRLRNLGGIIIIDFIDMAATSTRQAVLAEFRKQRARPHQDDGERLHAARPGGDDAQAHAREPRPHAVRALPDPRGPRAGEDRAQRLLRHPARDPAPGRRAARRTKAWFEVEPSKPPEHGRNRWSDIKAH